MGKARLKRLDKLLIVCMVLTLILGISLTAYATTFTSTLSLSSKGSMYGAFRNYTGNGNLKINFSGTGSSGNNGRNVIEPYERVLLLDIPCGYRYVGTSVNETWTDCPTGKYAFWFYNVGNTTWKSNKVTMSSW